MESSFALGALVLRLSLSSGNPAQRLPVYGQTKWLLLMAKVSSTRPAYVVMADCLDDDDDELT